MMKTLVIRTMVALAIVTGSTVMAEAKPVQMETVSNVTSISVVSTSSAVGVLAQR